MGVIGVSNAAFCGPGNVVFYEVVHLVLLLLLLGGTGDSVSMAVAAMAAERACVS